jgi:hypothetical protein
MQFVFAIFAALLRSDKGNGESLISKFRAKLPALPETPLIRMSLFRNRLATS